MAPILPEPVRRSAATAGRHLCPEACGTPLDWELLAQGAKGAKKKDLLDLSEPAIR